MTPPRLLALDVLGTDGRWHPGALPAGCALRLLVDTADGVIPQRITLQPDGVTEVLIGWGPDGVLRVYPAPHVADVDWSGP